MQKSIFFAGLLTALSLLGCGASDKPEKGCAVDIDCPGDLICVRAQCISGQLQTPDMGNDVSAQDMQVDDSGPEIIFPDMRVGPDMSPDMEETDMPGMTICEGAPTAAIAARLYGSARYSSGSTAGAVRQAIELTAANSSDTQPGELTYTWEITASPMDSSPELGESGEAGEGEEITFVGDAEGTYQIAMSAERQDGTGSCNTATMDITLTREGSQGITFLVDWETPNWTNPDPEIAAADIDIHYRQTGVGQWNNPPYDIYWDNQTADWGARGPTNNPILAFDSMTPSGNGEAVFHAEPEDEIYGFAVYYYNDNGLGSSYVTISIFVDGVLRWEERDFQLVQRAAFWHAINYDVANDTITEINQVTDGFPTP